MLKRYIGHQSPVSVVVGGQDFGYVETGDQIVVPDDLADSVTWPEENWADGDSKPTPRARAKSGDNKTEKSDE